MSASDNFTPAPGTTAVAAQSPLRAFAWVALSVLTTVGAALLIWEFRSVVLLLAAALVLAATIRPVSVWLTALGLRRNFATTMLVLLVVAGLLVIIGVSAYVLAEELPRAATELQINYAQVRNAMAEQSGWQGTIGKQLPPPEGFEDLVARSQLEAGAVAAASDAAATPAGAPQAVTAPQALSASEAPSAVDDQAGGPGDQPGTLQSAESAGDAANNAAPAGSLTTSAERASGLLRLFVGTTTSVLGLLSQFLILVFLSLYWSLDREWFERLWLSLLPADKRGAVRNGWRKIDGSLGAHVRSELVQAFIAFVLLYAGFRLMGAEYPLLMAWIAALAWMIPLVGWLAALAPVLVIGLLTSPAVAVGASLYLTLILVLLEFVVEPRLDMRRRAGSIVGLVVALVMLQAFGIVGLIVASPIAVMVDTFVSQWNAPRSATIPPPAATFAGAFEQLEARVATLRAAMETSDEEIPLSTRSLFERLQTLLNDTEKAL